MDEQELTAARQLLQQRIDQGQLDLPMLPQVVTEVLALVEDPDSEMAQLAALIQTDQSLAGHVMRIANSAAFNAAVPIASLQQGISRLGMQNIAEIALTATMGSTVFKVEGYEALIKHMWQFSLATGLWAKEIARLRRQNVENAFLCGLLLQVGKPVVLQALTEIQTSESVTLAPEAVAELVDQFQASVSAMLVETWQLPALVADTIRGVEDIQQLTDPAAGTFDTVATVNAAYFMTQQLLASEPMDVESLQSEQVLVDVNFYPEDVAQLIQHAPAISDTMEVLAL